MGKKAIAHVEQILKGILIIGFSVQIVLGIIWMCSNFAHVQDFGVPESAFYGVIFELVGEIPQVMYLLQLVVEFGACYALLQALCPVGKCFAVWRTLALMTFPFAMQMALAVQPYSLIGSLFLLVLYFVLNKRGKVWMRFSGALLCAALLMGLSGAWDDADGTRVWDYGWEASLAGRMAWPSIANDMDYWSDEVRQCAEEVWLETTFCADNMVLLLEAIEERAGGELARDYYLQIAAVGWEWRAPVIVRQIAWDVLGYALTPTVVPLQLDGKAYDSYTAGNYAVMREHTPRLASVYVAYGCWWFGCGLILTVVLWVTEKVAAMLLMGETAASPKGAVAGIVSRVTENRHAQFVVVTCVLLSGILVAALTFRSAGLMDYRWTVAVNQLWLVWGLALVRK